MTNCKDIESEICCLTAQLIDVGLCIKQNWPSCVKNNSEGKLVQSINICGVEELSFSLRNVSYDEIYEELIKRKAYNIYLIDGGLIQFLYTFQYDSLVKHTVSFYPCPNLLEYQNNPEIYETEILYAEVVYRNLVVTPIRIDYDPENFEDYIHPKTHLTIGQYRNCRIPTSSPVTPFQFVNLILRAFYNTPFNHYCEKLVKKSNFFDETITKKEASFPHIRMM